MSAWDSFLTGLSGLGSLLTGGATPIYGEPEGTDAKQRLRVVGDAGVKTAQDIAKDPLKPLKRGTEAVMSGITGVDIPWWVYAAGVVAAHGMVTGWLPRLVKRK